MSFLSIYLMMSGNAWAEEFTFNVPVKFTELRHDITKLKVTCSLRNGNGELIGLADVYENVTNGIINKTVKVGVNAYGDFNPEQAAAYNCYTAVCVNGGVDNECRTLSENSTDIAYKAAAGEPLKQDVVEFDF